MNSDLKEIYIKILREGCNIDSVAKGNKDNTYVITISSISMWPYDPADARNVYSYILAPRIVEWEQD